MYSDCKGVHCMVISALGTKQSIQMILYDNLCNFRLKGSQCKEQSAPPCYTDALVISQYGLQSAVYSYILHSLLANWPAPRR